MKDKNITTPWYEMRMEESIQLVLSTAQQRMIIIDSHPAKRLNDFILKKHFETHINETLKRFCCDTEIPVSLVFKK